MGYWRLDTNREKLGEFEDTAIETSQMKYREEKTEVMMSISKH